MIRKILITLSLFCAMLIASVGAQAQGSGMVREVFACNFLEGSDMDDLTAATDYMLEHLEMGGLPTVTTFVWTPLKSNNEYDFLWFNQFESLQQFGTLFDQYMNDPHGQMIEARFNTIVECSSGLVSHTQIYDGGSLTVNPPAFIAASACRLKAGHSLDEVAAVVGRFTDLIADLGSHSASTGFMQIPLVSSAGMDVYFYAVFDDAAAWGAADGAVQAAPQAAAIGADFNNLVRCNTSLWQGQNIVP